MLSREPIRIVEGVLDFIGEEREPAPRFYSDPLHVRFRAGLGRLHAAHYAEGSASGGIERSLKGLVVRLAKPAKPPIFDLGCGAGEGFKLFAPDDSAVVGVDTDLALLVEAKRKHPAATLIRAPLHDLPFKAGVMGTAFVVGVAEHLFELERSLACIARAMADAGTLYVLAPTEGGLAFSAARFVTSLRNGPLLGMSPAEARRAARIEHCNTVFAIESSLRKHFRTEAVRSWPFGVGPAALNLARAYRLRPI